MAVLFIILINYSNEIPDMSRMSNMKGDLTKGEFV
jgi:hypothetical protein